jgi:hypothetical protein
VLRYSLVLAEAADAPTGHVGGIVRDAVSRLALPGVAVVATRGTSVYRTETNASGVYGFDLPAGPDYRFDFTKNGYLSTTYHAVSVTPNFSQELLAVLQIDGAHSSAGTLGGVVVNAMSGQRIAGVALTVRAGVNALSGPVVRTAVSDAQGAYQFAALDAGSYTIVGEATGYSSSSVTGTCIGGLSTAAPGSGAHADRARGQWRIIVTWGASPSDLDSHLTGPAPDGSRFHLFYPDANSNGGGPWPEYQQLDLDDVTSYGPETTTLLQLLPGLYRFSVHDFSNRTATYSQALSNSAAQVRVYNSVGVNRVFNVPTGTEGTLWTVFEIQNGVVVPINQLSYQALPTDVTSAREVELKQRALLPAPSEVAPQRRR